ncbi:MAG: hypothetical protein ACK5Q5_12115 [Planctomycetaceae bacterium]
MLGNVLLRTACGLFLGGTFAVLVVLMPIQVRADEPQSLAPTVEPVPITDWSPAYSPPASGYVLPGGAPPAAMPMEALPVAPTGVRYWIVSSRHAAQSVSQLRCSRLHYCERRCDGSLCPSSLEGLRAQLIPGAPVLIMMHGSYVTWNDNLIQSEGTYHWIRRACPDRALNIIFFTWPSDQERKLLIPCELRRQGWEAEANSFYIASLLSAIPDCHPVCLLGHSYGARIALGAMHLGGGGALQGCRLNGSIGAKRVRVVLAAAAVDHNWLNDNGRYCQALCRSEGVLNLRHRHDGVLKLYPLLRPFSAHRALGASGVTFFDRRRQSCTCNIENFDVTGMVPNSHFWPEYYGTPQLAYSIAPWVYFPDVNPTYQALPYTDQVATNQVANRTAPPSLSLQQTMPADESQAASTVDQRLDGPALVNDDLRANSSPPGDRQQTNAIPLSRTADSRAEQYSQRQSIRR